MLLYILSLGVFFLPFSFYPYPNLFFSFSESMGDVRIFLFRRPDSVVLLVVLVELLVLFLLVFANGLRTKYTRVCRDDFPFFLSMTEPF